MKGYEQFYTCLNEVLQLKLLQIFAIYRNTIAWLNFLKKILELRETHFFQIRNKLGMPASAWIKQLRTLYVQIQKSKSQFFSYSTVYHNELTRF